MMNHCPMCDEDFDYYPYQEGLCAECDDEMAMAELEDEDSEENE